MPTTSLRRLIHRKLWAPCAPSLSASGNGASLSSQSTLPDNHALYIAGIALAYIYDANQDAWSQIASPALATVQSTHNPGVFHLMGPTGTASAGGASTITTATTIATNLANAANNGVMSDNREYQIRITGGTGAGQQRGIAKHTTGANGVITVSSAWTTQPDNTSTYVLITGRHYVYGGGTSTSFKYWDHCTQSWSAGLTMTSGPNFASSGDGFMVATPGSVQAVDATAKTSLGFSNGTASSGAGTTLTDASKAWTASQWVNYQVRIYSGTGAGQVRTITANTSTALTVATWGTNPDNTSKYVIEGNDDFIYVGGNASVTLFRYSISGNSWSTVAPGVARGGATGAGGAWAAWISGCDGADWNTENNGFNGRRIYSGRGGGGTVIDYYDIAANTWVSAVAYARVGPSATNGLGYAYDGGNYVYLIQPTGSSTASAYRLDLRGPVMEAFTILPVANGGAVLGQRAWMAQYNDGVGNPVRYLYFMLMTSTSVYRMQVI